MFEQMINITRISNGWLLRLPAQRSDMIREVLPHIGTIAKAFRNEADEDLDPEMSKIRRESVEDAMVSNMIPYNNELRFFPTIDEVFAYIKEHQ